MNTPFTADAPAKQIEELGAIAETEVDAVVLDSLIAGYDGYNGVMANFHIDIYKWLYLHYAEDPVLARKLSDFNENAVYEVEASIRMENAIRAELGLPL
jgi:dihydrodipicolinate synthase/N-acetylneuraminate lyase